MTVPTPAPRSGERSQCGGLRTGIVKRREALPCQRNSNWNQ